jgi:hypothetical protein
MEVALETLHSVPIARAHSSVEFFEHDRTQAHWAPPAIRLKPRATSSLIRKAVMYIDVSNSTGCIYGSSVP